MFALVLGSFWSVAETAVPEITDTDYHVRLRVIHSAAAAHPDQPLGIVLGSSRVVWAFQPEQLDDLPATNGVYWVNASHVGVGPTFGRLLLYRMLRDGVRPAVAVIEVMPTFFVKENARVVSSYFAAAELPLVRPYADHQFGFEYYFLRHRLTRAPDLARVADPFEGREIINPRGGFRGLEDDVTVEERAKRTAFAYKMNGAYLHNMAVRPGADRAFRDTLRQAAEYGIRVILLFTPEGPTFRSWYDHDGLARFERYIAGVAGEFGLPVVDGRLWLDEDDFYDSHHVLKRGAAKFTARFARELSAVLGAP
jgi:hypothetical protein